MENVDRQAGVRSRKARLWVASLVISEQKKRPIEQVHRELVATLGEALRPADISGALEFHKHYEEIRQRGLDLDRRFAGGLNLSDPTVVSFMTGLKPSTKPLSERPSRPPEKQIEALAEDDYLPLLTPVPPAPDVNTRDEEYLFQDWEHEAKVPDPFLSPRRTPLELQLQQQALDAYVKDIEKSERIPTTPYVRPDLGVCFFPTGRFTVADVDWNYNGQVEGRMISECEDNHLIYKNGTPLKGTIDFHDWAFSKTQRASGVIWVWAVRWVDGKSTRYWINDVDDQLKFYYTMNTRGARLLRKVPIEKGSKKFRKLDERQILPLELEGAPPIKR